MNRLFFSLVVVLSCCGCASGVSGSKFDPVTQDVPKIDKNYPPENFELSFRSAGKQLPAYLMVANGRGPHATIVLLHGLPGNEKNLDLAQSLRRAGFNVLFMHYRGAWGADGDFSFSNVSRDAAAALDYLRLNSSKYRIDALSMSLVGHSMGGFAALRTGARDQRLDCVVGLAAANIGEIPLRSVEEQTAFSRYLDSLFMLNNLSGRNGLAEIKANARSFDLRNDAAGLGGKSVLLISGLQDTSVPVAVQRRLASVYETNGRIALTALEIDGDHSFSGNRIQLQRLVVAWMSRNCRY
ncbi:MAG: alpha/beta hydrolase family protein [Woeseiaceae bacterium]